MCKKLSTCTRSMARRRKNKERNMTNPLYAKESSNSLFFHSGLANAPSSCSGSSAHSRGTPQCCNIRATPCTSPGPSRSSIAWSSSSDLASSIPAYPSALTSSLESDPSGSLIGKSGCERGMRCRWFLGEAHRLAPESTPLEQMRLTRSSADSNLRHAFHRHDATR